VSKPTPKVTNTQKPAEQPEYENMSEGQSQGRSWSSYIAILLVGVATILFILHNWTDVNVFGFLNGNQGGRDNRRNVVRDMNYGAGIREPQGRSYPRKNMNYTQSSAGYSRDAPNYMQQQQSSA